MSRCLKTLMTVAALWCAPAAACPEPPRVEVVADPAFGAVEAVRANFAAAYAAACADGLIGERGLGASLVLRNAPAANVALIFAAEGEGQLVLEYPFLADGKSQVPSAAEIKEAIFCHLRGATAREQEEEGRCLPD